MKTLEEKREYYREYRKKHREHRNKLQRERYARMKREIVEKLGKQCWICDKVKNQIVYHEIHGNTHSHSRNYILKHPEDFIPLCRSCHTAYHVFLKYREKFLELTEL